MKRILALGLVVAILFLMTGCSLDSVPEPMSYPDYTFDEVPDTTVLRNTAVKAMRDILSIQWHTEESYSYYKSGPVSSKHFQYEPGNIYAGILYTNANAGLFQFLEFYDQETGSLLYSDGVNKLKTDLGVSCADAVLWAWATVCTSISGPYYPNAMVYKNGFLPVGDYTYDQGLETFNYLPTLRIVNDNGKEVMAKAYAQVLQADALITSTDNHAMMAIEPAHVEYLADGSIDTANSYIMIQDQRAGGEAWQQTDADGNVLNYSGRTSAKFTFDELFDEHFIPVTAAEFVGEKEYEKATVTASQDTWDTLEAVLNATVESNYPLAVVNVIVNDQVVDRELFSGTANGGVPRSFALNKISTIKGFEASDYNRAGTTIDIEVVVSTGERFTPIEFTI